MTTDITPPDPARFDLSSFADLLPKRAPIVGEDAGSFEGFHAGMMHSLRPMTPYEGVIAENLIAIEWELLQHRRMRDAGLRQVVRDRVTKAVYKREGTARDDMRQEAWDELVEKAGQRMTGKIHVRKMRALNGSWFRPSFRMRYRGIPTPFWRPVQKSRAWGSIWLV